MTDEIRRLFVPDRVLFTAMLMTPPAAGPRMVPPVTVEGLLPTAPETMMPLFSVSSRPALMVTVAASGVLKVKPLMAMSDATLLVQAAVFT